jgi:hypothetical protein
MNIKIITNVSNKPLKCVAKGSVLVVPIVHTTLATSKASITDEPEIRV